MACRGFSMEHKTAVFTVEWLCNTPWKHSGTAKFILCRISCTVYICVFYSKFCKNNSWWWLSIMAETCRSKAYIKTKYNCFADYVIHFVWCAISRTGRGCNQVQFLPLPQHLLTCRFSLWLRNCVYRMLFLHYCIVFVCYRYCYC
jgi:hypothetical protein